MDTAKEKEIKKKIEDLKARWPKHSVPPHMWQELEDLELELEAALKDNSNIKEQKS
jgi:hypothetical protein